MIFHEPIRESNGKIPLGKNDYPTNFPYEQTPSPFPGSKPERGREFGYVFKLDMFLKLKSPIILPGSSLPFSGGDRLQNRLTRKHLPHFGPLRKQ